MIHFSNLISIVLNAKMLTTFKLFIKLCIKKLLMIFFLMYPLKEVLHVTIYKLLFQHIDMKKLMQGILLVENIINFYMIIYRLWKLWIGCQLEIN